MERFEDALSEFLGVNHVVATTSGSMALLLALLAAGVKPGDEVVIPNRTWIATGHAAQLLGATVKLADVHPNKSTILAEDAAKLMSNRTRAIIAVHLNGRAAPLEDLRNLAADWGCLLIEDAAQALGSMSEGGLLGAQSDIGCFSLSMAKIISTGQGGFLATNNSETADLLRQLRTHGVTDVFEAQWARPGGNFRFTDILAAVGLVQLEQLELRVIRLKEIHAAYSRKLENLPVNVIPLATKEVGPYVEILTTSRAELIEFLAKRKIETRTFYPNLSTAPYWQSSRCFPNSDIFESQGLWLPSGPELSDNQVDFVCEAISDFYEHR